MNLIEKYFYHPKHVGELDINNRDVRVGEAHTPDKSTIMKIFIQSNKSKIIAAKFKTLGSPWAIATTAYITEEIHGKSVQEALQITSKDIIERLELPDEHLYCALLGEDALKAAL